MKKLSNDECGGVCYSLVGLFLFVLFLLLVSNGDLVEWADRHPGLAAWVQAIGSVLAIIASSMLVFWQVSSSQKHSQRREIDEKINRLSILAVGNFSCIYSLKIAKFKLSNMQREEDLPVFQESIVNFEKFAEKLSLIPLIEIPDVWVAISLNRAVLELHSLRKRLNDLNLATKDELTAEIDSSLKEFIECERVIGKALEEIGASIPYSKVTVDDFVLHEYSRPIR